MVQIITPGPTTQTLRAQALNEALGQAIQGYGQYEEKQRQQAQTQRQQAMQDFNEQMQAANSGIASPISELKKYAQTGIMPTREAAPAQPAQEAQPAQYGNAPISSIANIRQVDEGNYPQMITKEAQPARPAIPAQTEQYNPFTNYTEAKKAQIARDLASKTAQEQLVQETIKNKQADTAKKQQEALTGGAKQANIEAGTEKIGSQTTQIDQKTKNLLSAPSLASNKQEMQTANKVSASIAQVRGDSQYKAAKDGQLAADKALILINKPGGWNDTEKALGTIEAAKAAIGGVPGHGEIATVAGNTAADKMAAAVHFITNVPAKPNDPAYRETLRSYMQDIKDISQKYIDQRNVRMLSTNGYMELTSPKLLARYEADPDISRAAKAVREQYKTNQSNGGVYTQQTVQPTTQEAPSQTTAPWLKYGKK